MLLQAGVPFYKPCMHPPHGRVQSATGFTMANQAHVALAMSSLQSLSPTRLFWLMPSLSLRHFLLRFRWTSLGDEWRDPAHEVAMPANREREAFESAVPDASADWINRRIGAEGLRLREAGQECPGYGLESGFLGREWRPE